MDTTARITTARYGVRVNQDSLAALEAIRATRAAQRPAVVMCAAHPSFEANYCPSCGTSQVIGGQS